MGDIGAGFVYHNTAAIFDRYIATVFTANSTSCFLETTQGGTQTRLKYVGTNPTFGGSASLIWVMSYQTIS